LCCDLWDQVGVVVGVEDAACDSPSKVVDSLPDSDSNSTQPHHLFQPFLLRGEKPTTNV